MKRKILNVLFILALVLSFSLATAAQTQEVHAAVTFTAQELLGRPTDNSVTVNVVADTALEVYFEYGTSPGVYTGQTGTATFAANTPIEMVIGGLASNTQYYYRMRYRQSGTTGEFLARDEHSFWTQRAQGSTFTFTITSDSHVNIVLGSASEWTKTLNNVALDQPDFHLDLGDTFAMDSVTVGDVAGAESKYLFQRPFFGIISHSAPIFLVDGNHEQTEGWHLLGTLANSLPVIGTNAMKKYFLNPVPDSFYSGNTDQYSYLDGDHLREDYYAWTWGDALFVVLDPFWYTTTKPYIGNTGGGEGDTTGSGDRWDWTLGLEQFNWFKQTLENSNAKYKFVFAHQMVGGSEDYGHGGANSINLVEMGGYNEAGTIYQWDTKRPVANWGFEPIHQIMVDNHVSAFFHGHDHQYAYEKRDGVVYQLVPAAGFTGPGFNLYTTGDGYTIKALPNDGHLRVTVTSTQATVDYIATSNRAVNYSYTILPNQTTNNPPNAVDDTATVNEDSINNVINVLINDTDPDSNPLSITSVTDPPHGTAANNVTSVTYTPDADYFGSDSFNYTISDGNGGSDTATVNVTINNVNDNPDAVDDAATVDKDSGPNTIDVLANDSYLPDPPETLTITGVTQGTHGTVANNGTSVTYTPEADYSGPDSFNYTISDGNGGSDTATVNVTVEATPEPGILGDVNGDDTVNSTDALIILSCDVGINTSQFCPMNCGDVNGDGYVNSTDALIILSYDVGITVPYPVGGPGCPSSVTQCPGCGP
jgi:hypothetical protein